MRVGGGGLGIVQNSNVKEGRDAGLDAFIDYLIDRMLASYFTYLITESRETSKCSTNVRPECHQRT